MIEWPLPLSGVVQVTDSDEQHFLLRVPRVQPHQALAQVPMQWMGPQTSVPILEVS